jgi:site-specific recombinase XerD
MRTLVSAYHEFILACMADGLSNSTVNWYRSLIGAFVETLNARLISDISTNELRQYITQLRRMGYADNSVSAHIRSLKKFWKWCSTEYGIANPMRTIRYPEKFQAKPKATHLETVRLMLEMAGSDDVGIRNRAISLFLLDTGCRAGGICGLRMQEIDLNERRALVTEKGNKTRAVTFTTLSAQAVREWMLVRKPAPTLFYNITTLEPLTPSGLLQLLRHIAQRAGIRDRFNPHSF